MKFKLVSFSVSLNLEPQRYITSCSAVGSLSNTYSTYTRKKKVRKPNFVIARLPILIMGVSTELWPLRTGCFTMPRTCKNLEL